MRISIAHELSDRGFGKTAILKSGTYIGGEDITVGKYILETCDDGKNTGESFIENLEFPFAMQHLNHRRDRAVSIIS